MNNPASSFFPTSHTAEAHSALRASIARDEARIAELEAELARRATVAALAPVPALPASANDNVEPPASFVECASMAAAIVASLAAAPIVRGEVSLAGMAYDYTASTQGYHLTHGRTVLTVRADGRIVHVSGPKPRRWSSLMWLRLGVDAAGRLAVAP